MQFYIKTLTLPDAWLIFLPKKTRNYTTTGTEGVYAASLISAKQTDSKTSNKRTTADRVTEQLSQST